MRKKLLLGLCALFMYSITFAQTTATGKVVDDKGAAVSGASVQEKGTKNGTVTSSDGSYSIKVKSGATLLISAVGYELVRVTAGSGVKSALTSESKTLTEVVVTGVGTATSKKKLAIEVASINTKDAAKSAIGSVEQALMGKVAGAQVQFNSGTPGTGASIILRGLNSLGDSYPLILLDGVEISDLNGVDLGNIERVEVVKGAAAGMLYGAQGGNGVVQIFTKKGSANKKPEITFTSQFSSGSIIKGKNSVIAQKHSFETDANGFITSSGAKLAVDANGSWGNPDFMDPTANYFVQNNKSYKEKVYDHLSQAYSTATTFNNTLNVTGGGEKSDYSFTLSRYQEKNVLNNSYNRTSLGANIGFQLAKGLTFRNSMQTIFTGDDLLSGDADATIGGTSTNRFALFNSFPYIDFTFKDPSGNRVVSANGGDKTTKNPLSEPDWRNRVTNRIRIIENANLNYKINKFIELDYKYGIEFTMMDRSNSYKNQTTALQSSTAYWGQTVKGSIYNESDKITRQNSIISAFIKTDFEKDFKINFPLKTVTQISYDYRKRERRNYFAQGTELPSFPPYNINVAANKTSGDFYGTFVTYGMLLNQTFDYKDLLGVSVGFRSDYSSAFGSGSTPFTFPRGTIYFRPTELIKIKPISEWKVRAAYGEAGIQPGDYDRQTTLSVQQLGSTSTIYNPSSLANPSLKIQHAKELEIGTDVTFLTKSKKWFTSLNMSFTYWKHSTADAIQPASLPLTSGASQILDNLASLESKGLDLSLDMRVLQTKDISWDFGARLGTTRSTVTAIANNADIVDGLFTVRAGQDIGLFSYMGPLTSIDQANGVSKVPYIAAADQGKYQVVNGMVVDTATKRVFMSAQADAKNVGSAYPNFTASFTNTFTYKNMLTLSFQFDWYQGNKIYNTTRQWLYRDRLSADYDKAVTINGNTGAYVSYYNSLYNSVSPSTWFVEDGSFLRLRDISLTYNLPSSIKFLKNSSITVSGRNLMTITNYSGLDPEATTTSDAQGNSSASKYVGAIKGADYFAVPNLKSVQVSMRIGF